jgi:hypothetical protein
MANPDRPSGFRPIKTLTGAPWTGMVRSIGVTDGADIFIGDLLTLTSNLAAVAASADTAFLGVAVGFGKVDAATGEYASAYNPDNLTTLYYDDSASTHTEWRVFYAPANHTIFEVQSALDLDLSVGSTADLLPTTGNTTSGRSQHEITTSSNTDVTVIEIPSYPDNDSTLINTRYWVQTITTAFSQ